MQHYHNVGHPSKQSLPGLQMLATSYMTSKTEAN